VLTTEAACPFCAEDLPANLADRAIPGATGRLNRAAVFLFGATLAVTGCGSDVNSPGAASGGTGGSTSASTGGPDDDGGVQPLYGDPTTTGTGGASGSSGSSGSTGVGGDGGKGGTGGAGGAGGAGGTGGEGGGVVPPYGTPPPPPKGT
jgi:hypothetical protein